MTFHWDWRDQPPAAINVGIDIESKGLCRAMARNVPIPASVIDSPAPKLAATARELESESRAKERDLNTKIAQLEKEKLELQRREAAKQGWKPSITEHSNTPNS